MILFIFLRPHRRPSGRKVGVNVRVEGKFQRRSEIYCHFNLNGDSKVSVPFQLTMTFPCKSATAFLCQLFKIKIFIFIVTISSRMSWSWRKMSKVLHDPVYHLASPVELWARTYSSSRLWLVTLCCWHTQAGAQTIVSDREREGHQNKTLWIVAPRNVFPGLESELHPCGLQRAAESARETRFSLLCGRGRSPFIFNVVQIYLSTEAAAKMVRFHFGAFWKNDCSKTQTKRRKNSFWRRLLFLCFLGHVALYVPF